MKIKIKKLVAITCVQIFWLKIKHLDFFQKICKMLKTTMWDYEKMSELTYPFYFINGQFI